MLDILQQQKKMNSTLSDIAEINSQMEIVLSDLSVSIGNIATSISSVESLVSKMSTIVPPTPAPVIPEIIIPGPTDEEKREAIKREERMIGLLEDISRYVKPETESPTPPPEQSSIGLIGTMLAASLAALAVTIEHNVKKIKLAFKALETLPSFLLKSLSYISDSISGIFSTKKTGFLGKLENGLNIGFKKLAAGLAAIANGLDSGFDFLKDIPSKLSEVSSIGSKVSRFIADIPNRFETLGNAFKFISDVVKDSKSFVIKIIDGIKDFSTKFLTPIKEGFEEIKKFSRPVKEIFQTISTGISKFTGMFSGVGSFISEIVEKFTIFGKLFTAFKRVFKFIPILGWAITVFDTINGIIEGYKETDSIIGAIKGGLKAFWDSFLGEFLNVVKDIISWIADKLGFETFSGWLDSIDFTFGDNTFMTKAVDAVNMRLEELANWLTDAVETGGKIIDAITHPMDTLANLFTSFGEWVSSLSLAEILKSFGVSEDTANGIQKVVDAGKETAAAIKGTYEGSVSNMADMMENIIPVATSATASGVETSSKLAGTFYTGKDLEGNTTYTKDSVVDILSKAIKETFSADAASELSTVSKGVTYNIVNNNVVAPNTNVSSPSASFSGGGGGARNTTAPSSFGMYGNN